MSNKKDLPDHITKGGPGDKYLGEGKVDTSQWFNGIDILEDQIRNDEIWFCSAPFQMIYTDTDGILAPCSWAYTEYRQTAHNIKDTDFSDYFSNNKELYNLRKEMVTPGSDLKTVEKVCASCRKQEKLYGRSRRQASLKIQTNDTFLWPEIRKMVEEFKRIGKPKINHRVFEIQIKAFGNKCNLDCFMCIPEDSSIRTATMNSDTFKNDDKIFGFEGREGIKKLKDSRLEEIIEQIVEIAPYIYNLKFIGGEPLVMKQFYTLLERLKDTGHAKGMRVKYQTNMSVLELDKVKITKFIPEFDLFEFTVSLDGVGKYNDYIRRRSNWNLIEENIEKVLTFPNVVVNINGTISFLSVLRFYKLIEWAKSNSKFGQINWSNIRNPAKLCANVLPKEIKEDLIPKYEGFPDIQNVLKEDNNGLHYQDAINYLLKMDKHYSGTNWEYHLFDIYPELEKFHTKDNQFLEVANNLGEKFGSSKTPG